MQKKIIFYFLMSILPAHAMDIWPLRTKKQTAQNVIENKAIRLWLKTEDNQYIKCPQTVINLSALLTLASQLPLFSKKNKALSVPISKKKLKFFIKIEKKLTDDTLFSLKTKQKYDLLSIAFALKAPKFYACLLKTLLLPEIDHKIASIISPIKTLKALVIKNNIPSTHLTTLDIPPTTNPTACIMYTSNEQYSIATIQADLLHNDNDDRFNCCLVINVLTRATIKSWQNYDLVVCSPQKNIIALGATKPCLSKPSLIIYDIDQNTSTALDTKAVSLITFSPNGNYLAVTHKNDSTHNVFLWKMDNLTINISLSGHTKPIDALEFNPNSTALISGSQEAHKSIILWTIEDDYNIKQKVLLTQHCHHFKKFIFNQTGSLVLARISADSSLLFELSDKTHCIPLKTPSYALYNASFIPEKICFIKKKNKTHVRTPYTIISGITTNYPIVTVSSDSAYSAAYNKVTRELTLYSLMTTNKKNIKKSLNNHFQHIHSLEFNDNNFLFSSCPSRTIIWDHKGTELQTINSSSDLLTAKPTPLGQYLFTISFTENNQFSCVELNAIKLYKNKTSHLLKDIELTLTTDQAIFLNALHKNQKNILSTLEPNTIDNFIFTSFTNDAQKLLNKTFKITHEPK